MINATVIFTPTGTDGKPLCFGDLLTQAGAEDILAAHRAAPDFEPTERWELHHDQAVSVLKSALLALVPVALAVEVQITLESIIATRADMHYLYDLVRAATPGMLHNCFGKKGSSSKEKIAKTLYNAAYSGQLSVAARLLAEHGYNVDGDAGAGANGGGGDGGVGKNAVNSISVLELINQKESRQDGATPLQVASNNNHPDIVALLLRAGADANCVDFHGVTPLYVAADSGHADVVEQLLCGGASPNPPPMGRNETGTPLMASNINVCANLMKLVLIICVSVCLYVCTCS